MYTWLLCPCPHRNVAPATCSVRVQKNTCVSVGTLPSSCPEPKRCRTEVTSHAASSSSAALSNVANPASSSADEIGIPMSRPQHVSIDSGAIHIGNAIIHHSHKIMIHRGLRYCGKCGCVATGQIRNLKRQCQPATRNGKANLICINDDRFPTSLPGRTQWPDGTTIR